jgi:hypothetical protein
LEFKNNFLNINKIRTNTIKLAKKYACKAPSKEKSGTKQKDNKRYATLNTISRIKYFLILALTTI